MSDIENTPELEEVTIRGYLYSVARLWEEKGARRVTIVLSTNDEEQLFPKVTGPVEINIKKVEPW